MHRIDALADRADKADKEIAFVRRDMAGLQAAVTHLSAGQERQSRILDDIAKAVHAKGTTSIAEIAQMMQVLVYGTVLIAAVVSGIVYIAGNAQNSEIALLKERMSQFRSGFGWQVQIKKDPP